MRTFKIIITPGFKYDLIVYTAREGTIDAARFDNIENLLEYIVEKYVDGEIKIEYDIP